MHYGQILEHCPLSQLWNELKLSCDFVKTREEVDKFNAHNRWRKRGIAMVPTKFGISFTTKFMNQVNSDFHHVLKKEEVILHEILGNSWMIRRKLVKFVLYVVLETIFWHKIG